MDEESKILLGEIKEMLKLIADGQEKLLRNIDEMKQEQKKLHEEIRLNNFVLNNIGIRSEIIN